MEFDEVYEEIRGVLVSLFLFKEKNSIIGFFFMSTESRTFKTDIKFNCLQKFTNWKSRNNN